MKNRVYNKQAVISEGTIFSCTAPDDKVYEIKFAINNKDDYVFFSHTYKMVFSGFKAGEEYLPDLKVGDRFQAYIPYNRSDGLSLSDTVAFRVIGEDTKFLEAMQKAIENYDPLLDKEPETATVWSGDKSNVLGRRAFIKLSKEEFDAITPERLYEFAKKRVEPNEKTYNWFSIIGSDGTGICFTGCSSVIGSYGKMDAEGCVVEEYGHYFIAENTYTYEEYHGEN